MLTAKQEGAIIDYVVHGMSKSDAYRNNYNTEKCSDKSVNENASQLFSNVNIASRVLELQAENKERLAVTVDTQVDEYRQLIKSARQLVNSTGGVTPKSIELQLKSLARIDRICGLEKTTADVLISSQPIQNDWHIHPVTTNKA